jgi:hypothetical protein
MVISITTLENCQVYELLVELRLECGENSAPGIADRPRSVNMNTHVSVPFVDVGDNQTLAVG